ncbi:MAG: hypothetical protein CFE28_11455 [Alphaproteobacteria bacterium PA2]|nr:MAG: hypothetical protein CFE28_11455 [Alphaproteobacteria bacterium PA2]
MSLATVLAADIAAGHDGEADLVITVRYENGVVGSVTLDADSAFEIMQSCGAASSADLVGRPWRDIMKGV